MSYWLKLAKEADKIISFEIGITYSKHYFLKIEFKLFIIIHVT